jgi:hypothetical protein
MALERTFEVAMDVSTDKTTNDISKKEDVAQVAIFYLGSIGMKSF